MASAKVTPTHPHTKVFPGKVRIVDPGPLKNGKPEFPAKTRDVYDHTKKPPKWKGTAVTVPAGADMTYSERKRPPEASPGAPKAFDVTVVRFEARDLTPPPAADTEPQTPEAKAAAAAASSPSPVLEAEAEKVYREDEKAPHRG